MSDPTTTRLMDALGFSPDDLAANQRGEVTAVQRAALETAIFDREGLTCALVALGGLGAGACVVCGVLFNIPVILGAVPGFVWAVVGLMAVAILAVLAVNWWGQRERAQTGDVALAVAEGELSLHPGDREITMQVGAMRFAITDDTYQRLRVLRLDYDYRVYYDANSGRILSMQALALPPYDG